MSSQLKPEFFYEGGGRSNILSQIHHCLRFSPGIIALTGPTGSGRSMMVRALVNSCKKSETDLCLLSEESAVLETEEELFRALAEGFGLEEKTIELVEDLVDRVQHFIEVDLCDKRNPLIVIDDVKQHSDEVLEALLQLGSSMKGLTLLLTGESSLVDTIKQFHVQSTQIHQIALRPLLAEEAFEFLHRYLLQQGVSVESVLNQKKLDELMINTGGNLSLLVQEVKQLVSGRELQAVRWYHNLPVAHVIALIVVVTITALAFWYYPTSRDTIHDDGATQKLADVVSTATDSATSTPIGADSAVNTVTSSDEAVAVDESARSPQSNTIEAASIYTLREQELLSRPARNITLQVLNSSSEKMVNSYIEQLTTVDKSMLSYYRRGTGRNTSYVVLYGDYSDMQKAVQEQKMLPAELKTSAPWPRHIAEVQQELRQRP